MARDAWSSRSRVAFTAIVILAMATGVGFRWRALSSGFASDDYVEYAMLKGVYPVQRAPFDLFNFTDGTYDEAKALMNFGALPWWTHPNLRLAMMRPLSSALIVLDHALFSRDPFYFHVHSMLWWAFLIFCVAQVLRELLPMPMAAIAVILFAIEEGHLLPVVWLANRSALVSLSLGLLGLWGHIRWRRSEWKPGFVISVTMFSLALLAGEWTFTVFAYLFAFELCGIDDPVRKRIRALIPTTVLGLVFICVRNQLNYGVLYSNVYINPIFEPLEFLKAASYRIPVFFADIVFGVPAYWWDAGSPWRSYFLSLNIFTPDIWTRLPNWQTWHLIIGTTAFIVALLIIVWGIRSAENRVPKEIRWLLLGGLLSLVPVSASFPSTRLVVPAMVGVSAVWALITLAGCRSLWISWTKRRLRSMIVALSILTGMGYFQVWVTANSSYREVISRAYSHESTKEWILHAEIDDQKAASQDVFLINGIEHTSMVFTPFVRFYHLHPLLRSCRILSAAPRAHDILRSADNQLVFSVLGGSMLLSDLEKLYRADRFPFHAGDVVELDGLKVEILEVLQDKPYTVRFTFDKALEDTSYLFLYSSGRGLREFKLPAIGERIRIPRAQYPNAAFL